MLDDQTLVTRDALAAMVRRTIADVLVISPDRVHDDSVIVAELGAESIDFLDLIFRLEDGIGKSIPMEHWQHFLTERLPGADYMAAITPAIVTEFAEREARR